MGFERIAVFILATTKVNIQHDRETPQDFPTYWESRILPIGNDIEFN
jgi:hypothetical protein